MKIKKIILSIFSSVLLGYLCGIIVYKVYEDSTYEKISSNKVYLLQSGSYSSIDSMKMNNNTTNYVYYVDSGLYKTIIALTKNKDNIKKIKDSYGINLIINEYFIEDDDINNKITVLDNKLKEEDNIEEIINIVNEMLLLYKEKDNLKLVKTY